MWGVTHLYVCATPYLCCSNVYEGHVCVAAMYICCSNVYRDMISVFAAMYMRDTSVLPQCICVLQQCIQGHDICVAAMYTRDMSVLQQYICVLQQCIQGHDICVAAMRDMIYFYVGRD